jgi:putative ABC transport system substrate-binding protein
VSKTRKRKLIFAALAGLFLALIFPAEAQQPKKVPRIGYISSQGAASESARAEEIRLTLRELGYVEGQNVAIEYRYAEGNVDQASEFAVELVRLKVDIIVVAGGTPWVQAAKNAAKTIPIVMVGAGADPVEAGLVKSLAHPGGNVTGITNLGRELGGKRLELLKEAVPKLTRIAVLYDPAVPATALEVKKEIAVAARALRLTVRSWEVRDAAAFEKVFLALKKERPDGLYMPRRGPLIKTNEKHIASFALTSQLPSVYGYRGGVEAGGLLYYGPNEADSFRRVAYYVDRIFNGAKPADLPVEQAAKFDLVINLKTAQQIGLIIPPNLLARADRVIK